MYELPPVIDGGNTLWSHKPSQGCNAKSQDTQATTTALWQQQRRAFLDGSQRGKQKKHTTGGIPRWSPTLVLVARFSAYVWQSGRDAQFSLTYGRMCYKI
jgi:hypothetical protein